MTLVLSRADVLNGLRQAVWLHLDTGSAWFTILRFPGLASEQRLSFRRRALRRFDQRVVLHRELWPGERQVRVAVETDICSVDVLVHAAVMKNQWRCRIALLIADADRHPSVSDTATKSRDTI